MSQASWLARPTRFWKTMRIVFSRFVSSVLPQRSRLPWLLAPSSEVETGLSMLGGSLIRFMLPRRWWTSLPERLRLDVISDGRSHYCDLWLGIVLMRNLH